MEIRFALPDEADQIAAVIQDGFDSSMLCLMIHGCAGINRFIRHQVSLPVALSTTRYVVAVERDQVVGAVEMRCLRDTLFLNYISVKRECRRDGLGSRLLRQTIAYCRTAQRFLSLDVLTFNQPARTWYEGLGLAYGEPTYWYSLPLIERSTGVTGAIHDFPQAEVCHEAFGFSMCTVKTVTGDYAVGRIGKDWFRVTRADVLSDLDLLTTLVQLDARRRLLLLLPHQSNMVERGGELLTITHRMTGELDVIMHRLDRSKGV